MHDEKFSNMIPELVFGGRGQSREARSSLTADSAGSATSICAGISDTLNDQQRAAVEEALKADVAMSILYPGKKICIQGVPRK